MRFLNSVAALAALVTFASAQYGNDSIAYTTTTLTAITTYCPTPTSIVQGNQTYVVTEATTLTITNCPCTLSMPVVTPPIPSAPPVPIVTAPKIVPTSSETPVYANSSAAAATPATSPIAPAGTGSASAAPAAPTFATAGAGRIVIEFTVAGLAGILVLLQ